MKPEHDSSLVDIVDRLLNKGLVLNADLIILVAGIPMIGLNLRAVLASMETMLEYGIMDDWDKATREWYARQKSIAPLLEGEKILFKSFGYIWQSNGIANNWVPGVWHITNMRLFLWRKDSTEMLFASFLTEINALSIVASQNGMTELKLIYQDEVARICISDMEKFKDAFENATLSNLAAAPT
ncbi:MAG: gas vesicle protein [Methanotrichaceae archaeon]